MSTSVYSSGVRLHQTRLCFVPVRSGRSVLLNKKKGSNTCSSSSYKTVFSRASRNLFDVGNQSRSTHLANNIPFSVRSSALWRGLRHEPQETPAAGYLVTVVNLCASVNGGQHLLFFHVRWTVILFFKSRSVGCLQRFRKACLFLASSKSGSRIRS